MCCVTAEPCIDVMDRAGPGRRASGPARQGLSFQGLNERSDDARRCDW